MKDNTDRFFNSRWGVFNHFLYGDPGADLNFGPDLVDWNERVNNFDTEKLALTLHNMGASYYFITIMQGRKYMIAPNSAFDKICGTKPGEACAKRDLVLDLYKSLSKYDIDLYLYFTADGPYKDKELGEKFGFVEPRKNVTMDFSKKWASVLEEYAVRYGDKVCGWWIDGSYDIFGYNDELLSPYYNAIKKGNKKAIAAFNNGVKSELHKWYKDEEYTAGEFNDFYYIPNTRFIDNAQAHILAPLGISPDGNEFNGWHQKGAKHDKKYMKNYINAVNNAGGVVTVDIYVYPDGSFDKEQVDVLTGI